jgi:hypothetical protein
MKEKIELSKSVDIGSDLSATAFRPNYIYLYDDGITVYFDPAIIPPLKLTYPENEAKNAVGQVLMPLEIADNFKSALAAALSLCKGRMETPFVEPIK